MFRRLWKLIDELAPSFTDALVHNIGALWDFLGFFGLPVALTLGLVVIGGALHLNDRYFRNSIADRRTRGQADIAEQPVLALTPKLKGLKRIVRPRRRPLLVHLDAEGIRIDRKTSTTDVAWQHVAAWQRTQLTHWTLHTATGEIAIALSEEHGFTVDELRRIEDRLIYHVTMMPQITFLGEVRTSLKAWQARMARVLRRLHVHSRRSRSTISHYERTQFPDGSLTRRCSCRADSETGGYPDAS